jgi:uncharacterized protein YbbC (DUF1343 family)
MKTIGIVFFSLWAISISLCCYSQDKPGKALRFVSADDVIVGADRTEEYFPILENMSLAIVANQTSMIGEVHLVDSLLNAGYSVEKVFCPEHGFRGEKEAGEMIKSGKDPITGLPVISLYGKHLKPSKKDLKKVELVLFDLQDVGARFYTYISTMALVMEACAERGIPVIVLDRPNPNGFYVDGPVLTTQYKSFVGMHPVPVVHGMTVGEYAMMVNGEGWLEGSVYCDLKVIQVVNYEHNMIYKLPVKPSPNLPNWKAIYLYPSLALFEGTIISEGRGTDKPFQIIGHPEYKKGSYSFTPKSLQGAENPKFLNQLCHGLNLGNFASQMMNQPRQIHLRWLIDMARYFSDRNDFFNNYFNYLAGGTSLKAQIKLGLSETEIRKSWKTGINKFKEIRRKYLLYPDFE